MTGHSGEAVRARSAPSELEQAPVCWSGDSLGEACGGPGQCDLGSGLAQAGRHLVDTRTHTPQAGLWPLAVCVAARLSPRSRDVSGPPLGVPRATHKSAQESRVQEGGGDVYLHTCVHSESACLHKCACVCLCGVGSASYPRAEVSSVRMLGVRPACAGTYGSGVQTCAEVSPYVCARVGSACARVCGRGSVWGVQLWLK